ncbi:MAG: prepilin-type N-terminal cleavage/methylation domain-containing protein [Nitrospirae bacterium]|nr:prepilin-type N-terminal cleavage/methylation domain-containing protein [Nitrospirota bacterium]
MNRMDSKVFCTRLRCAGFSLVEVLVAILVFSISLAAIIPLLVTSSRVDKDNAVRAEIQTLAADELDRMKTDPANFTLDFSRGAVKREVTETRGGVEYTITRTVELWKGSNLPDGSKPLMLSVNVSADLRGETISLPNPLVAIMGR